jgi:hypothetical protein
MSKNTSAAERHFHLARKAAKSGKCGKALAAFGDGQAAFGKALASGDAISAHNYNASDRAQHELEDRCLVNKAFNGLAGRRRRRRSR